MVGWPDDAPRWEPYLCWQIGRTEPEAVEGMRRLAAEEFEKRFGAKPEHVFYHLRAIYVGPIKSRGEDGRNA